MKIAFQNLRERLQRDCDLTQGFNLDCIDNYGGVNEIKIAEYDSVTTMTVTAGVISAVTKATGKKFWKYELEAHTGNATFEGTKDRGAGTTTVKQTVTFPIHKLQSSVLTELAQVAKNRLLVAVKDENGDAWMYGYSYGLIATNIKGDTGTALADKAGVDVTLESEEKFFPYKIDPTVYDGLETPGV